MVPYRIDLDCLERLHYRGDKIEARCPACAEGGADRQGNHFFLKPSTGAWGCAAHATDRPHRQRIFALVGIAHDGKAPFTYPRSLQWMKWKQERETPQLHHTALKHQAAIFKRYAWSRADMWHDSPSLLEHPSAQAWRCIVGLFPANALVWIGEPHDSGPGRGEDHFLPPEAWLKWEHFPAGRVAPSTFLAGPSRSIAAVAKAHFICVEADTACGFEPKSNEEKARNKVASSALIRWLKERVGWHLRAVIDTGNKSLHAWFDHPGSAAMEELAQVAPAWGIDAGLLRNPAAPLRLPGCLHQKTGLPAALLYWDHLS